MTQPAIQSHTTQGLSEAEAAERRRSGLGNDARFSTTRSYGQILRQNAFTFINVILFAISLILVGMGLRGDAVVTAGLVLLNVAVGVYQEVRAKRKLEEIALLARPRATVIRDGRETSVDPAVVVLGDLLLARPGDQLVVDGQVVGMGWMDVDESLLTGESEPVRKVAGDPVHSGSYCVAGGARYRAERVGADSVANRLTRQAQAFRQVKTPLQREMDRLIRVLVAVATALGILLALSFYRSALPPVETVRMAAVVVALVPQGLFFMTTAAYAMGAVRVAGQGALIQQANAVESTSHVNLLCLDKTGTLTTNHLQVHDVRPVGDDLDLDDLRALLGDLAASGTVRNGTTEALAAAFDGARRPLVAEVPFASGRRWSAVSFDDPERSGSYVLGAPEVLGLWLGDAVSTPAYEDWTEQGLRVLLFARTSQVLAGAGAGDANVPPGPLQPLALLSLCDELRPEARDTLGHFARLGVGLKVISGDHPQALQAVARQAGLAGPMEVVSGLDLEQMDDARLAEAARKATIFGRTSPQQKERLVLLYRRLGYYVAMVGDGVNDVLSLKQANLGVAMESGSAATRGVADVVLLGDSFAALPVALREGQRIVRGMEDVVRLLLTRSLYVLLFIVGAQLAGLPFPITPKHNSLLALLTVGIPILAIAAWARPGQPRPILRSVRHFVLPASLTIAALALGVYLTALRTTSSLTEARSAVTVTCVLCGLLLIPFVEPPTATWTGGDELSGDRRPALLALGMLALLGLVLTFAPLRQFFELAPLSPLHWAGLAALTAAWAVIQRWVWRARCLERLLGWSERDSPAPS